MENVNREASEVKQDRDAERRRVDSDTDTRYSTSMVVRVLAWASLEDRHREKILSRSEQDISAIEPRVQAIIDRVSAATESP